MIVINLYQRTFCFKGNGYGSAFVIDYEGKEYIVTARHLLLAVEDGKTKIGLFMHERWEEFAADAIGIGRGEVDVAVLHIDRRLIAPEFTVDVSMEGLMQGQDVYFLGSPYAMMGPSRFLDNGQPFAFVKKGTLSLLEDRNSRAMVIDALNNQGFSGGPVVFLPYNNPDPTKAKIVGVVSHFKTESEPILDDKGEKTGHTTEYNTGFMYAFGIGKALDMIKSKVGA
jgi:hypothetical protein